MVVSECAGKLPTGWPVREKMWKHFQIVILPDQIRVLRNDLGGELGMHISDFCIGNTKIGGTAVPISQATGYFLQASQAIAERPDFIRRPAQTNGLFPAIVLNRVKYRP